MTTPTTNKIKYGLRNVHYAPITEDGSTGAITYGAPKRLPGGVSLTLTPAGDSAEFYADDSSYFSESTNNGYDGELELANLTDEFRVDILGDTYEAGVMYENADQTTNKFAIMFEFQGDKKAKRHVLYYCSAARPTVSGTTKGQTTEPQTSALTFISRPRPDTKDVKADSTPEVDTTVYNGWYNSVHEKGVNVTVTPNSATISVSGTQQLTAIVTGATDTTVTWTSSDETVATVDASGLVTVDAAATTGESATITATSAEDATKSDSATITVA